jgi:hypothetical protein
LENLLQKANVTVETSYPEPPEFIAQRDRVLVVGFATGRIKATNKIFEDHWVFDIAVRNGKLTNIREYIDTQALARASETAASRPSEISYQRISVSARSDALIQSDWFQDVFVLYLKRHLNATVRRYDPFLRSYKSGKLTPGQSSIRSSLR